MRIARYSTKNRSHGRNLLTCENFVDDSYHDSLSLLAQNPQHFLVTYNIAILKRRILYAI